MGGSCAGVIIEAEEVYKTYDTGRVKVPALRGVDLQVTRGEMVAIMGPSGCGKTTLLNCLSGLDEIDSGSVTIGGADLVRMKDNEKTRYRATRMGYVLPVVQPAAGAHGAGERGDAAAGFAHQGEPS